MRITTDEGFTGWGESYSGCYATEVTQAALIRLSAGLVGQNVLDYDGLLANMRFKNRYWAMRGLGAQATSAIEGAVLDLAAQALGQPLWKLLGAAKPEPIVLYASAGENVSCPEDILTEARFYASQGYRAYKLRCGGARYTDSSNRLALDIERVAAAREGLGSEGMLFVDVAVPQRPVAWERGRAEAYVEALRRFDVSFLEEPAMTYDVVRYRELQALHLIPTAGGESFCCPEEFEPFFEAGAYGVAQPDAAVVGGPQSCLRVCQRAQALGVPVSLHAWSAGVGLAQNLHAGWAANGILAMEWPQAVHPLASRPIEGLLEFRNGYAVPCEKPGLGVAIPEAMLSEYAYQSGCDRDF